MNTIYSEGDIVYVMIDSFRKRAILEEDVKEGDVEAFATVWNVKNSVVNTNELDFKMEPCNVVVPIEDILGWDEGDDWDYTTLEHLAQIEGSGVEMLYKDFQELEVFKPHGTITDDQGKRNTCTTTEWWKAAFLIDGEEVKFDIFYRNGIYIPSEDYKTVEYVSKHTSDISMQEMQEMEDIS